MSYDWDAHWAKVTAEIAGREAETVHLATVLHSVFTDRAWPTGELDCWCETWDETGNIPTYHPDPSTNCWRLAAVILLEQ